MNKTLLNLLIASASLVFLASCQDTDKDGKKLDTPTSGHINISIDESLQPLAELEVSAFENVYAKAGFTVSYKPESETVADLLSDSGARVVMMTRLLTSKEEEYFKSIEIKPRVSKLAYDAVALIIHPEMNDSTLTFDELSGILSGKVTNWNQIGENNPDAPLSVVFDNANSSTLNYLRNEFSIDSLPKGFFALNSNPEVINYISANKNAIGVIGLSWISDKKDSVANSFLNKVKVVGLAPPDSVVGADRPYYKPYQYYISTGYYPLRREVYLISREPRAGLATGFMSYVAGPQGQAIVRLAGLLPATMPLRVVNVTKELKYK